MGACLFPWWARRSWMKETEHQSDTGDYILKISFQHQTVQETEKQYGENRVGGREGRSTVRGRGRSDE